MTHRTKPADMAPNRDIIGRVGEDEICGLAFHEDAEAAPVQRIAAEQPVASKLPATACSCKEGSRSPGSGASGFSPRLSIRKSISPISNPVASRSKLRSRMDSSLSCSARSRPSQLEFSVNLLSAIAKARCCAASRCSSAITGTSVQPSSFAAKIRPWPAMTLCCASISTGTLKPKLAMLLAICRTCLRLCSRGFCGSSFNATIGS